MLLIRPIETSDLEPLLELAALTGFGLTTLPRDRDLLAGRVSESQHAFARLGQRAPQGENYLFVMEDVGAGVIGTCGITSKVGGFEPFYAYRVEQFVAQSEMLNVSKEIRTLTLVAEHNGPCEIGSLFLHPAYRRDPHKGAGRMLSLSRFLFLAEHRHSFEPTVIAEMRGVIDERGRSPFWDALGKHFFDIEFPKADYLSMVNKRFIADLMPRHPIYITLLPAEAQAVIGKVHSDTRPALKLLQSEGFHITDMVDIFEAGPIVSASQDNIRTVRQAQRASVGEISDGPLEETSAQPPGGGAVVAMHILNPRNSFTVRGPVARLPNGDAKIDFLAARALQVDRGEAIRFAPAHDRQPQDPGLP